MSSSLNTLVEEGTGTKIDYVNAIVIFLTTFIAGIVLAFYGPNNDNNILGFIGLLFAFLSLAGVYLINDVGGSFFKNKTTVFEANFAMWVPIILINLASVFRPAGETFSALKSAPGQTYAATALDGEPAGIQTLTEVFLASAGENLSLIGLGLIPVVFMVDQFGKSLQSLMVGLIPMALAFVGIHTENLTLAELQFLSTAFLLIYVIGLFLFGADLGVEGISDMGIFATMAFFHGVHFGLNSANTHGLIGVFFGEPYGILNIAHPDLGMIGVMYLVVYLVSFLFAAVYALTKLYERVR